MLLNRQAHFFPSWYLMEILAFALKGLLALPVHKGERTGCLLQCSYRCIPEVLPDCLWCVSLDWLRILLEFSCAELSF